MKLCPECFQRYGDEAKFCEADGHELSDGPAFSAQIETVGAPPSSRGAWWPAAALGILVGVVIGAAIFAAGSLMSGSESREAPAPTRVVETRERVSPTRSVTSNSAPTPTVEDSPSPETEEQAEAEVSPTMEEAKTTTSAELNQGPISTGEKNPQSLESDSSGQTVIEMNDGSTLDVDAAWQDKQGIWYRRSSVVSFVESSRVKAISRRETKIPDTPHR